MHNETMARLMHQVAPLSESRGRIGATAKRVFETPVRGLTVDCLQGSLARVLSKVPCGILRE